MVYKIEHFYLIINPLHVVFPPNEYINSQNLETLFWNITELWLNKKLQIWIAGCSQRRYLAILYVLKVYRSHSYPLHHIVAGRNN